MRTSTEQVAAFRRDGAVVLRGILSRDRLATLERGVERNLADLSPLGMNATKPGEPGAFVEDFRNWQRIPEYAEAVEGSRLPAAAAALMGAREVRLFHDHLLVKEAGTLDRSPWHQDQPYYCIDGSQTVSFWIPLDPVARPSTLEFVAGSHAGGRWYMPRSFVRGRRWCSRRARWRRCPTLELPALDVPRAAVGLDAPGAPLEHPLFPVLWRT
jgi:ectoine hydroxylase-related dioxygenase (phytanoyl-CoA dioxygenase family)